MGGVEKSASPFYLTSQNKYNKYNGKIILSLRYAKRAQRAKRRSPLWIPPGFLFENDGSLPSDGFELVTPAFREDEDLSSLPKIVVDAANEPISSACGGHIHMSIAGATTSEENFNFFLPALALGLIVFRKRFNARYCSGERIDRARSAPVNFTGGHIEFRFPPGVKDFEALKWRHRLFAELTAMLKSSSRGEAGAAILAALNNKESKLHSILLERIDQEMIDEYAFVYPSVHDVLVMAEDRLPNAWFQTAAMTEGKKTSESRRPENGGFGLSAPINLFLRPSAEKVLSGIKSSPIMKDYEEKIKILIS
jgi:hypothetical protein